jgi:hypothetical protein
MINLFSEISPKTFLIAAQIGHFLNYVLIFKELKADNPEFQITLLRMLALHTLSSCLEDIILCSHHMNTLFFTTKVMIGVYLGLQRLGVSEFVQIFTLIISFIALKYSIM